MTSTPNSLQNAVFGEPAGMGGMKQNSSQTSFDPKNHPRQSMSHEGSADTPNTEADAKHIPEKELVLPNNDDSAIDLEDDPMMIAVGKYNDMMASDPADAEGDVVVI